MKTLSQNRIFAMSVIGLSLSIILGYIEVIFSINIGYIGVKIGFTNIVTLIYLEIIGIRWTFIINVLRLIILGILFSNFIRFVISVSGFMLSFLLMCIVMKKLNFSIVFTSIVGGVAHNIGQLISVSFVMNNTNVFYMTYIYVCFGAVFGLIIGLISYMCYKKVLKVIIE